MPGMQQVHQLDVLNLLRVMSRLNRLRMTSGLRAHLHRWALEARQANMHVENTTRIQMTQTTHRHSQTLV